MYFHCRRNVFHTGNKISIESGEKGQTALVYCAECNSGPTRFPLAEQYGTVAWNPTQKGPPIN